MIPIPAQQELGHHGADALVPVQEGVVGGQAIAQPCDFFHIGLEKFLPAEGLKGRRQSGLQTSSVTQSVHPAGGGDDPAVDQNDILCCNCSHCAILS